ncbi:MAG: 3-oxoadipate enol-lactonase [Acidobacteria bacterium]|nr:MAG: 3-oxoadipate enol-lactonase [Acidobacteriota bacterium]
MPLLTLRDATIFYRLSGRDDRPVLVLSHSLGQDHGMWDAQVPDLSARFRVLRYDTRGHGASSATPGDYRVEQLARDVIALADAVGIARFAFCGLSLGGMIGQWLAAHAPDRITAAVLANTSARPDAERMEARRRAVLAGGMRAVADDVMARFFSPKMLAADSGTVADARRTLLATDPAGYAGCCAAIRDMDQGAALGSIRCPVLVIGGDLDVALPWSGHGALLARDIAGAAVVHLAAAHLSNLECPRAFTAAVLRFLEPAGAASESGMRVRRAVLGDAHVDRALAETTDFTRDFQDLIARYAWGAIWTRPGLDVRTRRLLVLAMTAAMGRWEEFRLHVRTGLPRELEWCDLEEVLLQTAIYAGVPAANTGFHLASAEREQGGAKPPVA